MADPSINVDIKATDKTKAATITARNRFGSIGGKAKSAFSNISALALGPVGAIAGIGAAALGLVTNFASTADEFSKLSQRTGISTEELSKLRHAFDQNDLTAEQFEKTLTRMNNAIGSGEGASKKVDAALEQLGITWEELEGKTPTEQFHLLADSLSDVEDVQERVAISSDIFGEKLGGSLQTVVEGGAAGLEAYAEEAEELGKVISQETADEAASFNDTVDEIGDVLGSVGNTLGDTLIPLLNTLAQTVLPLVKTGIRLFRPVLQLAGVIIGNVATVLATLIGYFLQFIEDTGILDFLDSLAEGFGDGEDFITGFGDTVKNVLTTVGNIFRGVFKFIGDVIKFGVSLYIAYIKDLAFGIVSFIEGGINGFLSIIEEGLNFGAGLFKDFVNGVISFIEGLANSIIDIIVGLIEPHNVGLNWHFLNPIIEGLEAARPDFGRVDLDRIEVGRVDLIGSTGLEGGNIQSVIAGGFPVLNINVEGSILSEGDLANVVNKVSTVGLVGAG